MLVGQEPLIAESVIIKDAQLSSDEVRPSTENLSCLRERERESLTDLPSSDETDADHYGKPFCEVQSDMSLRTGL